MKFATRNEANKFFDGWLMATAHIVAGNCWENRRTSNGRHEHVQTYKGRPWFTREYYAHKLHPAVYDMIVEHLYEPQRYVQLVLEWPHKSKTDPNRLAYTRDERSGEADRQTVTTIGKYLTRHFPDAPDNIIRDVVAMHTYGGSTVIVDSLDKMVQAVTDGPSSCMSKHFVMLCDDGRQRHPYAVYDPSLGWRMAVRYEGDEVMGRCLLWHDPDDEAIKGFVRSYKRERGYSSHSGADEAIETFLRSQGYEKWGGWPEGTPVLKYELRRGGYLMPYIDGGNQMVDNDRGATFSITCRGDYDATSTSGMINGYTCTCDHCGAGFNDEDEGGWVYNDESSHVCQDCLDNEFTYVYGRRGNEYYILSRDAIEVDGNYYDPDYLSDNNICELHDGEYCDLDNAVYIESEDAYYHCDDEDICYADDTHQHELRDNCWRCTETGNWYTEDEDYVEVDGDRYHPDHAPDVAEEEETNEGEQA